MVKMLACVPILRKKGAQIISQQIENYRTSRGPHIKDAKLHIVNEIHAKVSSYFC